MSEDSNSNKTLEELLKLASVPSTKSKSEEDNLDPLEREVRQFILERGIRNGKVGVINSVIYQTYLNWAQDPMTYNGFFIRFSKTFKKMRHSNYRYYNLNEEPFDLSSESYFKSRKMKFDGKTKGKK